MSRVVKISIPDDVQSTLRARAALEGMSLSNLIKRELARTAERPSMREW
ncbi:MAG: hypothetical protein M3Y72_08290 [Acidobacteriota bacterium]|nr:hypothetical protein [Acidobacteriota bacterium]